MTGEPTLSSRTIGETENALRAILLRGLAGTGLDYHQWIALKVTSESQTPLAVPVLVSLLRGGLKIDEAAALAAVQAVRAAGLFGPDGPVVEVTPDGTALYRRLDAEFAGLTRQMYAGLEADELATAYRVLSTLTVRANALLAS